MACSSANAAEEDRQSTNGAARADGSISGVTPPTDTDGDLVFDDIDNCIEIPNPDQRDTDADGHGNICDPDLSNDCVVNFTDVNDLRTVFFTTDPDADFAGDGFVNAVDMGVMSQFLFASPGPSAFPNSCNQPE